MRITRRKYPDCLEPFEHKLDGCKLEAALAQIFFLLSLTFQAYLVYASILKIINFKRK